LRLSGEEKAGRAGRDAWAAVNDEVLARVARSGMEQLSLYFRNPDAGSAIAAADQPPSAPGMARSDDFRPETYGITRRPAEGAASATAAGESSPPARRPIARPGAVAQAD
jgi:hypothetical protein